jgi:hypothetical protein
MMSQRAHAGSSLLLNWSHHIQTEEPADISNLKTGNTKLMRTLTFPSCLNCHNQEANLKHIQHLFISMAKVYYSS